MALVPSHHNNTLNNNNDIAAQFSELMMANEALAKENRLFDSFLRRSAAAAANQNQHDQDTKTPKTGGRRGGTGRAQHEPVLTEADKVRIANEEKSYRTSQLQALEEKARADVNLLKAITEGIKIRINELRKETYEFQRDIVIGAENSRTGKIMAEKVIRYFQEKLKQKAALVEKMKLKNKAHKTQLQKMDSTVRHKEEQGDSLKPIDYHQLRIKNNQFNQKIKDCNDDLLKLKQTTGKTVQELNTQKRKLNELMALSKKLKKDLKEKEIAKIKLTAELEKVENEVRREKLKNKKFKIQQSNPDMPQVLDYVNQKSSMYDLEGAVHNWERKIEIIEMAAKRARAILKQEEFIKRQEEKEANAINHNKDHSLLGVGGNKITNNNNNAPPSSAPHNNNNNNNNNNINNNNSFSRSYSNSSSAANSTRFPKI